MNEFMSKPIRKKVLFEKLSLVLTDHPAVIEQSEALADAPEAEKSAPEALPITPPAEVALTDVGTILDRRTFEELADAVGREGVRAILDVYTVETVARIDLLRSFSCECDRARIKDEAHTLKGASGTFGLRQVSDLARTLEYSAHTIAAPEYGNVVERLDACFQRGREEAERISFHACGAGVKLKRGHQGHARKPELNCVFTASARPGSAGACCADWQDRPAWVLRSRSGEASAQGQGCLRGSPQSRR